MRPPKITFAQWHNVHSGERIEKNILGKSVTGVAKFRNFFLITQKQTVKKAVKNCNHPTFLAIVAKLHPALQKRPKWFFPMTNSTATSTRAGAQWMGGNGWLQCQMWCYFSRSIAMFLWWKLCWWYCLHILPECFLYLLICGCEFIHHVFSPKTKPKVTSNYKHC